MLLALLMCPRNVQLYFLHSHCITVILSFIVLLYFGSLFNMHMFVVLDFTGM